MVEMPGAVSLSNLQVYDATNSEDGQRGGTPHLHFVCTEMYVVRSGSGFVETIDRQGFSRYELRPGAVLVFTAGTIHRLINPQSDLELAVIMGNRGLPERGDAAVCFEPTYLKDPPTFTAAMSAQTMEQALVRRDRGVHGFLQLKEAFKKSQATGEQVYKAFCQQAMACVQPKTTQWADIVQIGAQADAQASLDCIQKLQHGDISALLDAAQQLHLPKQPHKPGFCGLLYPLVSYDTLLPKSTPPNN